MYSKLEKEKILTKIESKPHLYVMTGHYETQPSVLCMFTDKPVVHEYNQKANDEKYLRGWGVNVTLSNGETVSCIASHNSYDENDINDSDDFLVD